MQTPTIFNEFPEEINAKMAQVMEAFESPLCDMLRDHLGWMDEIGLPAQSPAGKMMRPGSTSTALGEPWLL